DDCIGDFRVECARILVDLRTSCLQQTHCANLCRFESATGDWEVFDRTLGLRAPQGILWNLYFTHRVMLNAIFSHEIHLLCREYQSIELERVPSRHVSRYWVRLCGF